jgi:deoxyribodipyrimidine photo-lyase
MSEFFRPARVPITFPTDYQSIVARIDTINPIEYGKSRNWIDGAVTYLSPYISRGVISIKHVQEAVLSKGHPPVAVEKFLQELAWREYFQRVWQAKGDALFTDLKQPQADVLHKHMISAVAEAQTGVHAIDKKILELYKSGYMHNHVRMYVASIACNIGKAHWSAPAQWMYYHLLDGDLASNTCSWQWVAGAFSSKKYYCNQENINRYTHSQQSKTFLDTTTDTLASAPMPKALVSTVGLKLKTTLPNVPKPIIHVNKPTLLYNSYNLDPIWRKQEDVNRILLLEPSHFQKFPVSEKVLDFILQLSRNIPSCQVMVGEVDELKALYSQTSFRDKGLISKEHPAFRHYPGIKDERDWIYLDTTGYFNSFFSFWKKCRLSEKPKLFTYLKPQITQ